MKPARILHLLSQRPSMTGSGVTLDALVRTAGARWRQRAVVGVPAGEALPRFGGLAAGEVHALEFGEPPLGFPVPGMSDVMPYRSTVFSRMGGDQLAAYRSSWRDHLDVVLQQFRPDLIHVHHVWLLASMVKDAATDVPVVNHCHATGLRQIALCPHLADEVIEGCRRNERFAVLHAGHAAELARTLGVAAERIHVVGAGYRDDLFFPSPGGSPAPRLAYVGKYSHAKGLPQLLDALQRLQREHRSLQLHVAGGGEGDEADALRRRMHAMGDVVVQHGMLAQPRLAEMLRGCSVAVLPSFYEGVPLVLVEAMACGCRLVATDLEGVRRELAPHLEDALQVVPMPRLEGIDTPTAGDLPAFVEALTAALDEALGRPPLDAGDIAQRARPFTWAGVSGRVEAIWNELIE
jgi:glycosyltransferase involved in cell wall biosynthesis